MSIERLNLSPGDLFTRSQAISAGVSGRTLAALVASASIARLGPGIYCAGAADALDPRGAAMTLRGLLGYQTAAAWLGADLPTVPVLSHVTVPRSRGRRSDCITGVRLHRADLAPDERMMFRGTELTAPTRTILDIARSAELSEAVAIGDSLCRLGRTTPAEALRAATSLPRGPGRQAAITVAAMLDAAAESVFESITRVRVVVAGLPLPVSQFNVFDAAGCWIARVDFAWPELRLILECDGFEFHASREQFERDRRRWTALTRAGWRVAVVTWRDVLGDPAYLLEALHDLHG